MRSSGRWFGVSSVFLVALGCGPRGHAPRPPHDPIAADATVALSEAPSADPPERNSADAAPMDAGVAAPNDGAPTRPPPPAPCELRPGELTTVKCTPDKSLPYEARGRVLRNTPRGGVIELEIALEQDLRLETGDKVDIQPSDRPTARPWKGMVARVVAPNQLRVFVKLRVDATRVVIRRSR